MDGIDGNRRTGRGPAGFVLEDEPLRRARERARQLGVAAVSPAGGEALRLLAAAAGAKSVAEIGTGVGVSGIYLLQGMRVDGVLTTVELEPSRQALAREAFGEAGFPANRVRIIHGLALDVLPRLADGGYDLVFCDGDRAEWAVYVAASLRLLRPGGVLCVAAAGAAEVAAVRELEGVVASVLPGPDRLLFAVRR